MFKSRTPLGDDFSNATNFFVSKPNDVSNLEQRETYDVADSIAELPTVSIFNYALLL